MCQVYDDFITPPYRPPPHTDAEFSDDFFTPLTDAVLHARTQAFLIEMGIGPVDPDDPNVNYQWLCAQGEGHLFPNPADYPLLEPLPESSPEEVEAIKADLMAKAPKAYFYEGEGIWLQYPGAHRQVRAGDAREGDPKPKPEALALKQASYRTTRKLRRKGGTGAS